MTRAPFPQGWPPGDSNPPHNELVRTFPVLYRMVSATLECACFLTFFWESLCSSYWHLHRCPANSSHASWASLSVYPMWISCASVCSFTSKWHSRIGDSGHWIIDEHKKNQQHRKVISNKKKKKDARRGGRTPNLVISSGEDQYWRTVSELFWSWWLEKGRLTKSHALPIELAGLICW